MTDHAAYHRHLEIVASQAESLRNKVEDLREAIEVARKWDSNYASSAARREQVLKLINRSGKIQREASVILDWIIDVAVETMAR